MVLRFQHACNGEVPENAVVACKDDDGNNLYVARAKYNNQGLCPGKLVAGCNGAYVGLYGQHLMEEYEILVQEGHDNLQWLHVCNGELPSGASALKTGYETKTKGAPKPIPMFTARGKVNGSMTLGKMSTKHKKSWMTHDGRESECFDYEVLCVKEIIDMTG